LAVVARRTQHFGDLERAAALAGLDLASLPGTPQSQTIPISGKK
jgi:hypothetical protein